MTSSEKTDQSDAAQLNDLRAQLVAAHKEIERLQSLLAQSRTATSVQRQEVRNLNELRLIDGAALSASKETIKHQSDELDLARHALSLRAELEAANKELETFSYSVSHDLRSPLRAINGFAKALIEDYGSTMPEEARRYLLNIENGALRMGALIDDLLSFSRLSRLDLTRTNVDMNAMVHGVWNELAQERVDRDVDFNSPQLPGIEADRALIKQVLINLLSNALKFTSQREKTIVSISFTSSDTETIFCVHDNGVGFDVRYADKLFGPFQRLHKAKDFPGTGIGLALVQRIVHRHGGRVWAESELDKGASFYFSIPIKENADHDGN